MAWLLTRARGTPLAKRERELYFDTDCLLCELTNGATVLALQAQLQHLELGQQQSRRPRPPVFYTITASPNLPFTLPDGCHYLSRWPPQTW